jgi:predicted nucleic acid binding AN1-type Zn finger protein
MDLAQIGAHCSVSSCNVLDFLPITCKCEGIYCSQHISPDRHDCPILKASIASDLPTFEDQLRRCDVDGCKKLSLRSASSNANETCAACSKSFCVEHRHPESHQCPSVCKPESAATETDKKLPMPVYIPKKFKKPPTDPAKLAQWRKLEVMKMRHKASPGDPKDKNSSLPPDQRLHIKLFAGDTDHIFWFRRTIGTGRALDLLVEQMKLKFPGNPVRCEFK